MILAEIAMEMHLDFDEANLDLAIEDIDQIDPYVRVLGVG